MTRNSRLGLAFHAMKAIGIDKDKVKPVLKKLLQLYDKNWEMIEAENYRVLADAIFDDEDTKEPEQKKCTAADPEEFEDNDSAEEPERPLKRIRLRHQEGQASTYNGNPSSISVGMLSKMPKEEGDEQLPGSDLVPESPSDFEDGRTGRQFSLSGPAVPNHCSRSKGKEPVSPYAASGPNGCTPQKRSLALCIKEPESHPRINLFSMNGVPETDALMIPKQEPIDEIVHDEVPLAVIHPDVEDSSTGNVLAEKEEVQVPPASELAEEENMCYNDSASSSEKRLCCEVSRVPGEFPPSLEVASSGEEELRIEVPNIEVLKKSGLQDSLGVEQNSETIFMPSMVQDGSFAAQCSISGSLKDGSGKELVVVEHQLTSDELRSISYANDITKGEESVPVTWVNEISRDLPPPFYYISQSLVFQSACVNISLSRIKDQSYCPACSGNCLLSPTPCHCRIRGGRDFAYTTEGVVKDDFLEECVSMTRDPQKQSLLNCKVCPLEKSKNDEFLEPCKGHLKRKVIKECCCKCGCNKLCGNRVVQRGIQYKLQVFLTQNGTGWGLRTLEKLPKDAHWALKGVSKDEEALCLDATSYGNVARFINHRCLDANLIEIPIEVETRDLHYYRLAFFTTREVNALEELTWDYGIDFDDQDNPIKGFQCKCGSQFCRNMKRCARSAKIIR